MRLDRYLSQVTPFTRSQARKLIRGGHVTVNNEAVREAASAVPADSDVRLDGESLPRPGHRYFMLHKPRGYVCASGDRQHSTVLDLLREPRDEGLHVAGRLDIDVTGLVLLTDDGDWSHRLTSPRRKCPKSYRVDLRDPLSAEAAQQLREGVLLRGEARPTLPAELELLTLKRVRLTIREGRYHQVKRMFAAVGNQVVALHRESIGELRLDPLLQTGDYRPLSAAEVETVFRACEASPRSNEPVAKLASLEETGSMTVRMQSSLETFQASLLRLRESPDFLPAFYRRFISSSDEVARIFENRDMQQLQQKLKMTLEMVADAAMGKPGLALYLDMLGKVHKRLDIKAEYFQLWKRSLLETVALQDPEFDESVRKAWLSVVDKVIEEHLCRDT